MATKPSVNPEWAENDVVDGTSGQNNKVEPPTSWKNNGWSYQEKPARNYDNWFKNNVATWIRYLDDSSTRAFTYKIAASDSSADSQNQADAVCGSNNAQVEINAGIAAIDAEVAPGGMILLSEGVFVLNSAIVLNAKSNIHIRGCGKGATVLNIPDSTSTDYNLVDIIGSSNITVSGLTVDGGADTVTGEHNGINCNGSSGVSIVDCSAVNMERTSTKGHGIRIESSSSDCLIHGCSASSNEGNGIVTDSSPGTRIVGSRCASNSLANFSLGSETSASACVSESGTLQGFLVVGSGVEITGSLSKGNGSAGFDFSGDNSSASGCSAISNTTYGFYLQGELQSVVGCEARGNTDNAIQLSGSTLSHVSGCVVSLNDKDGIALTGGSSLFHVVGNTISTNGQLTDDTYMGINVASANNGVISGNSVYRGTVAPQQKLGIGGTQLQSPNNNYIYGNNFTNSGSTSSIESGAQGLTIPEYVGSGASTNAQNDITKANSV